MNRQGIVLMRELSERAPLFRACRFRWSDWVKILIGPVFGLLIAGGLSAETGSERIRLLNIRGEIFTGSLISRDESNWKLNDAEPREISVGEVVAADWIDRQIRPANRLPQVVLVNGDRISLQLQSWDEEALAGTGLISVENPLRIPLEYVRGLILHPLPDGDRLALEFQRLETHPPGKDLITLSNSDQVGGQILNLDQGMLRFERESASLSLALDKIRSIALNPELSVFPGATATDSVSLTLIDGSCLSLHNWKRASDTLSGTWLGNLELVIPETAIAGFRPNLPNVQPLEELPPDLYQFVPFLGSTSVEFRRNRNSRGGPLSLDGRAYPRGIGVRSRSQLAWNLGGKYKSFFATVGIDDAAGNRGSAECRLIVDGKTVHTRAPIRGGEPPSSIPPIDLTGALQLQMVVDFGEEGDVLDLVDCVDAYLIK